MLKINLENELLKIEKTDIDSRIKKAIINPKIESKIFKIKKVNYLTIIAMFIIGVIIICIGAFFQEGNKKPIMIACIIVGVIILISTLIPAFIAPYISFNLLKKSSLSQINGVFLTDIFNIMMFKVENMNFKHISFVDGFVQIKFSVNDNDFQLSKKENEMILLCNNYEIIGSKKIMNFHSDKIKYKLSTIDMYKQSNVENFVSFVSDEIKYKIQMILKDILLWLIQIKEINNEDF